MADISKNPVAAQTSSCDKKIYMSPKLTVYGDISEITLKVEGLQDHNQSGGNANNQGWAPGHPKYVS